MHYYREKPGERQVSREEYYKRRRRCIRGLKAEELSQMNIKYKQEILKLNIPGLDQIIQFIEGYNSISRHSIFEDQYDPSSSNEDDLQSSFINNTDINGGKIGNNEGISDRDEDQVREYINHNTLLQITNEGILPKPRDIKDKDEDKDEDKGINNQDLDINSKLQENFQNGEYSNFRVICDAQNKILHSGNEPDIPKDFELCLLDPRETYQVSKSDTLGLDFNMFDPYFHNTNSNKNTICTMNSYNNLNIEEDDTTSRRNENNTFIESLFNLKSKFSSNQNSISNHNSNHILNGKSYHKSSQFQDNNFGGERNLHFDLSRMLLLEEEHLVELIKNILTGNSILKYFSEKFLMQLLPFCDILEFRKGDTILEEGEYNLNSCFLILSGNVLLRRSNSINMELFGEEYIKYLYPYDSFAEIALYDHKARADATCIAESDVKCVRIMANCFELIIRSQRLEFSEENKHEIISIC